jgi:hypothetical protein
MAECRGDGAVGELPSREHGRRAAHSPSDRRARHDALFAAHVSQRGCLRHADGRRLARTSGSETLPEVPP